MDSNPLNDLAKEILDKYGEWIEHGIYDLDKLLLILLLLEREKNKGLQKWQK